MVEPSDSTSTAVCRYSAPACCIDRLKNQNVVVLQSSYNILLPGLTLFLLVLSVSQFQAPLAFLFIPVECRFVQLHEKVKNRFCILRENVELNEYTKE